jgi:hypothetical protein
MMAMAAAPLLLLLAVECGCSPLVPAMTAVFDEEEDEEERLWRRPEARWPGWFAVVS